jgi:hypothetical protein
MEDDGVDGACSKLERYKKKKKYKILVTNPERA